MGIYIAKGSKEIKEKISDTSDWLLANTDAPLAEFEEVARIRNIHTVKLKALDKPKTWNIKPKP